MIGRLRAVLRGGTLACAAAGCGVVAVLGIAVATRAALEGLPASLHFALNAGAAAGDWRAVQLTDRRGEPLNETFVGEWNVRDVVPLHEVPQFLRDAFVAAEDKRFYEHHGVDWRARTVALAMNVRYGRAVRGASTITEQVVRMLHPRPRTLWSRWVEGFEAAALERRFTKSEILELYLNEVPYAANRRGVVQAASYYFARDLGTLSRKEMLALAVLPRAPTRFDLARAPKASRGAIERLAAALVARGALAPEERAAVLAAPLELEPPRLAVVAPHFLQYARARWLASGAAAASKVATTLDGRLQAAVQRLLDARVRDLTRRGVGDGAVLAVDHTTGEVLAWVVAGGGDPAGPASYIDAVTTPRQPGSALKPFLYALALDRGFTAADVIDDAPLTESTSGGLHDYQNYSRRFYGPVAVRDALGNSLNIPALKTVQLVGTDAYLARLRALGFESLSEHPDFYGDGIALGGGAVTLYELVQGYAALANGGVLRPLSVLRDDAGARPARRVYSAEAASLVANILSDSNARALEFGRDSVLALPVQTAVKTGTSSDFRDAWTVGFDYRYTVGVWFGNLDDSPSAGVTGSTGPALLLRSVFAELTRGEETRPLYLSPRLERRRVCVPAPQRSAGGCIERDEWFLPGTRPAAAAARVAPQPIRFDKPTPGLALAFDPRLPSAAQVFRFALTGVETGDRVQWRVDGRGESRDGATYDWPVSRGAHRVGASVWRGGALIAKLREVEFDVK